MPQFSKVAAEGDTVLMGLEGDPLFPFKSGRERPSAVITKVTHRDNDSIVTLRMKDGSTQNVNSMTLAADQIWEFDDKSFQTVLERQKAEVTARSESKVEEVPEYRGIDDSVVNSLKQEIDSLKQELAAERENSKNFHNTMIASMNEMASDICKLDTSGKHTDFCKTLTGEYTKLMESRAEGNLNTVNTDYRGIESESDFSADDTDFF